MPTLDVLSQHITHCLAYLNYFTIQTHRAPAWFIYKSNYMETIHDFVSTTSDSIYHGVDLMMTFCGERLTSPV